MRLMLVLVPAVAGAVLAVGTPAAQADRSKPIVVTFEKHLVDPENLVFAGTSGGKAKGDLMSRMVPGSLTIDGAIWHFAFEWTVNGKSPHKSFVARTSGTFDTTTGRVVMEGSVIDGWLEGAPVHEQGQLIDPATFTFAGELAIDPDDD